MLQTDIQGVISGGSFQAVRGFAHCVGFIVPD
jgi:hypothetical protein